MSTLDRTEFLAKDKVKQALAELKSATRRALPAADFAEREEAMLVLLDEAGRGLLETAGWSARRMHRSGPNIGEMAEERAASTPAKLQRKCRNPRKRRAPKPFDVDFRVAYLGTSHRQQTLVASYAVHRTAERLTSSPLQPVRFGLFDVNRDWDA